MSEIRRRLHTGNADSELSEEQLQRLLGILHEHDTQMATA